MRTTKGHLLAIALIVPSILAVAILVYGYTGWTVRAALSKWEGLLPVQIYVGLSNSVHLFGNPR